jgi:hypothetical protein
MEYCQPFISLYVPSPVNNYISCNTFVRYVDSDSEGMERVELIVSINSNNTSVTICRFFSRTQLRSYIGANCLNDKSLWPIDEHSPPFYLCDSDVTVAVPIQSLLGLAFVLYIDDPILERVHSMANTFAVSSYFNTVTMTCMHVRSFQSFPSLAFSQFLPTCAPLQILNQLLSINEGVQKKLNSRSMNARCISICVVKI